MRHEVIRELYNISLDIVKLNSNIKRDQEGIEALKKEIKGYENGIKSLNDKLTEICNEYSINIDNLLQ